MCRGPAHDCLHSHDDDFDRSTTQWKTPNRQRAASRRPSGVGEASVSVSTSAASASHGKQRSVLPDTWTMQDTLTRSGLAKFFQQGVDSTDWQVFDPSERLRLAYVGTPISNLTHLVDLKRPFPPTLHYPYPQIRPDLPWKPEGNLWGLHNVDIVQDVGSFPAKEVRDALVDAFFTKIHPGFPIVDEASFRASYEDAENPPPLLLFQAVLLAGAHVCDHPRVANSRPMVKDTLYRRASMLFHLRHESDRMQLMQAALLFTWHLHNADTVSANSYYWLGVACRIGFGIGVHRNLAPNASSRMPVHERRIYRRVWWTAFQSEILSALEHGRPCMISMDDTDQPPLTREDFLEGEGQVMNQNVQFEFCEKNISLCCIILDILTMNTPTARRMGLSLNLPAINARLALWAVGLPRGDDAWSCQLRMHYNLVLLHLHRNFTYQNIDNETASDSQNICREATQAILACFELMHAHKTLGQCHFTCVIAMTAALIQTTRDVRLAVEQGSSLVAFNALARLLRLLGCAKELAKYWVNAEAVVKIFESLYKEYEIRTLESVQGHPTAQEETTQNAGTPAIDWERLLGTLYSTQPPEFDEEQWSNIAKWME